MRQNWYFLHYYKYIGQRVCGWRVTSMWI